MNNELTNMDIIEVLKDFSEKMDRQFEKINQKIDDFRIEVNQKFVEIDQRLDYNETWLNRIEKNMFTKKDFNGFIDSFNSLVYVLKDKAVISSPESVRFSYPKIIN